MECLLRLFPLKSCTSRIREAENMKQSKISLQFPSLLIIFLVVIVSLLGKGTKLNVSDQTLIFANKLLCQFTVVLQISVIG